MPTVEPDVLVDQVTRLPEDFGLLLETVPAMVDASLPDAHLAAVDEVVLVGSGDSYHAACAAQTAFEALAGLRCEPMSALRYLHYARRHEPPADRPTGLVVGISASGRTEPVLRALHRARERGQRTLGVTCTPGSDITRVADHDIVCRLPDSQPSPGIRTYQAGLLSVLLLAVHAGRAGRGPAAELDAARSDLAGCADVLAAVPRSLAGPCARLADAISDATAACVLGSGPNRGTALYAAAKLTEGAGLFAVGQDLEEWCHIERFADPPDMPVLLLSVPGRASCDAERVAARAAGLGRRVAVVGEPADPALQHAAIGLALPGDGVREELSPLLYHAFAGLVAAELARRRGMLAFQGGVAR
ncbi:SIS domain-containing protein [Saccharopolyspora sp. SCSIO 74807]|uniref:SIS domain-containing protein n=1 Tax=Saccharopolyspora sp. SCSIO 74807 TaxID=3118084 RepID=UPI0030CD9DB0